MTSLRSQLTPREESEARAMLERFERHQATALPDGETLYTILPRRLSNVDRVQRAAGNTF